MLTTILLLILIFGTGIGGFMLRAAGGLLSIFLWVVAACAIVGLAMRLLR